MGRLRDQMFRIGARELEDCACARPRLRPTRRAGRPDAARHADRARRPCSSPGSSSSPPAARRRCTGSRRRHARRRATGWRCASAPGSSCATWRCSSSIRPGSSPERRALTGCGARGGAARRRRAPLQRARRAVHGALRPGAARALDARRRRPRRATLEIVEGRGTPAGGVLLDVSHLGADEVERRFGGMAARTRLDRRRPRDRAGRGLADSPLPHGRRHDRRGLPHSDRTACSSPARTRAGPTARTASAETASQSRPCSGRGPATRPRRWCGDRASTSPIRMLVAASVERRVRRR